MTSTQPLASGTPPYMPFQRFEGFVAGLHGKPLPPRIDRTLMRSMSGSDQSQLRIALRFLRLTEGDEFAITDALKTLVASYAPGSENRKGAFAAVVRAAYEPIVGGLDDAATMGQLEERFRDRGGLNGSSMKKAIRFYITAADAAGMALSPHVRNAGIGSVGSSSTPRRTRKSNRDNGGEMHREPGNIEKIPPGVEEIIVPVPGKTVKVWFPTDLTPKEFDFVVSTLTARRALAE